MTHLAPVEPALADLRLETRSYTQLTPSRLPDNEQIFNALDYAYHHSPVPEDKLSSEGRELIQDVRDIIKTMGDMVESKNRDELIQETVFNSYGVDLSHAQQSGVNPIDKAEAKADRDEAGKHLRVLATLFLTNGEVRKLVKDLGIVGRDMFATGAVKAADAARPNTDQLNQIDQPAADRTWVGPDGQTLGPNDSPTLAMKTADGSQVRYDPKDAPGQAQIIGKDGNTRTAGEAYGQYQETKGNVMSQARQAGQQAMQGARDAHQQGHGISGAAQAGAQNAANQQGYNQGQQGQGNPLMENVQHHGSAIDRERDPNASYGTQARQMAAGARQHGQNDPQMQDAQDAAHGRFQAAKEKIPEEHRQRLNNAANEVEQIFRDEFPKERRDQFVYRLKKVLVEVQQHKDYYEAMDWLLTSVEKYKGYGMHVAEKGNAARQDAAADSHATGTLDSFLLILERFANGQSLTPIRRALDQLYTDTMNDQQLRAWWNAVDEYVHAVLLEPGYVMDDDCNTHGRQLRDTGRQFFEGRYKAHWDNLWDVMTSWLKAFHDDPLNRQFGEDWKRLTKDVLFDGDGKLTFKPHLWNDIRKVILPSLIRNIGYVPIPRAEYTDDKLDLVVENLILSGPNLFPNIVTLENHNFFQFAPSGNIRDRNHNRFKLGVQQIQADIRDVRFAFKKKSGFPRLKDSGIADVVVARQGISIEVELETVEDRPDTIFVVRRVNTTVDELSFKLRDTKHDMLYKFIKGPATGVIKKALAKGIEAGIRSALEYVDEQLVEVRNTIDQSKDQDEVTRKQALQQLYKRKKAEAAEAKGKVDEHKPKGEFKVVTDRDESLLPNMSQDPSKSIAKRLWKTEDAARSGRTWHSPAFSIAGNTAHPAVTGQHHPHAAGGAARGTGMTAAAGQRMDDRRDDGRDRTLGDRAREATTGDRYGDNTRGDRYTDTRDDGRHGHGMGAAAGAAGLGGAAGLAAGHATGRHHDQDTRHTGQQYDQRDERGLGHSGVGHTGTQGHHTGVGQTGTHGHTGVGQTGTQQTGGATGSKQGVEQAMQELRATGATDQTGSQQGYQQGTQQGYQQGTQQGYQQGTQQQYQGQGQHSGVGQAAGVGAGAGLGAGALAGGVGHQSGGQQYPGGQATGQQLEQQQLGQQYVGQQAGQQQVGGQQQHLGQPQAIGGQQYSNQQQGQYAQQQVPGQQQAGHTGLAGATGQHLGNHPQQPSGTYHGERIPDGGQVASQHLAGGQGQQGYTGQQLAGQQTQQGQTQQESGGLMGMARSAVNAVTGGGNNNQGSATSAGAPVQQQQQRPM